jgi:hypothetical protein
MKEDAEVIHSQHVIEAESSELRLRLVKRGGNGRERANG